MSSANGLPSNRPLASRVVASSAPLFSASASSAALAPDQTAPRPPMTIGRSAPAIIATTSSTNAGSGITTCATRHEIGRGRVVGQVRKFLLLQVERDAQHHRAALGAGHVKGLADIVERPVDRADRHEMRAGRQRQRRLVDLLHVPGRADRRVAGKDHERRVAARGHRQRGHDLGKAGAAGDRGDADLADARA